MILFTVLILINYIYSRISNAPFSAFERDLDYPKIMATIDKYRANPKLHPETSNYLLIIKANYTINYDPALAESLWSAVTLFLLIPPTA